MARILCIDDEPAVLDLFRRILTRSGHDIVTAVSADDAWDVIVRDHGLDLIVCDFQMPGTSGVQLLGRLTAAGIGIPLIIVTGHATIENAVACLKAGAVDYLVKPFHPRQLEIVVEHALGVVELKRVNEELRNQVRTFTGSAEIIGESESLEKILELLRAASPTRATVLLQGESGTGKEVLARAIHDMSARTGPFVSINCAALPETLVESILFGHEKGAFTGALKQSKGAFERADGGTLLLDEVSEMRLDLQSKLLRVLQEQEFERVGGTAPIRVDTRIVATTNRDLLADVKNGRFREDLYYRLAVVPVRVPPLRERVEDIPLLAIYFAAKAARELKRPIHAISPDAMDLLTRYRWPGNVRELAHTIERAVIFAQSPTLDLHSVTLPGRVPHSNAIVPLDADSVAEIEEPGYTLPTLSLADAERILIEHALEATSHNRTRAAELLGISVRTLRTRLNAPAG